MRSSRVLRALRAGRPAFSLKLNLGDARVAEIAAQSGIDCLWLDMEHTASDWSSIQHQIMAAKIYDVDTVVRVARGSYSDYIRPLELDAAGIMAPHVMDGEEASAVGRSTKFYPVGMRALDGGNADGGYTRLDLASYMREANQERMTIVQIEDVQALDHLDDICAAPGVDMVFFGPGDFSQSIGRPGAFDDPDVREACRRIAKAADTHDVFAGTVAQPADVTRLLDLGYRFLNIGADVGSLTLSFGAAVAEAQQTSHIIQTTL